MKKLIVIMLLAASLMLTACDPERRVQGETTTRGVTTTEAPQPDKALADMNVEDLKNTIINTLGYLDTDNFGSHEIQVIEANLNPDLGKINRYNFVHMDRNSGVFDVLFDMYEFEDASKVSSLKPGDTLKILVDGEASKVNPDDTVTVTAVNGKFVITIKDYADVKGGEVPVANTTGTFSSTSAQAIYDRFISLK
jgi:hypothetical protein